MQHAGRGPVGKGEPTGWREQVAASLDLPVGPESVVVLENVECPGLVPTRARLFIAGVSGAGDQSVMERLCYEGPNSSFVVREPQDLRGLVAVQSTTAALTYARLFTSPATAKCLPQPWWIEVVPRRELDHGLLLGIRRKVYFLGSVDAPSGTLGVLSEADWDRSGLRLAAVSRRGASFVVKRALFEATTRSPRTHTVWEVSETVGPDGAFERRTSRRLTRWRLNLNVAVDIM